MNIAVIFGGESSEHDISCLSAENIIKNLQDIEDVSVLKIGITLTGKWFLTQADTKSIGNGKWEEEDNVPLLIDLNMKRFMTPQGPLAIDLVFPVLHGKYGEDGTIQGLFSCLSLPFVGCGVQASATCMDKTKLNKMLDHLNIPHTPWFSFTEKEYDITKNDILDRIEKEFDFPVYIKPSRAGSSCGITKCTCKEDIEDAVLTAMEIDSIIIVEQGQVDIKELEVAVIGNNFSPIVSGVGRVMSGEEFFTYSAKYTNTASYNMIPADITPSQRDQVREYAKRVFKEIGCNGMSRVDFFLRSDGLLLLNEINTCPGFTSISMYPQLLLHDGMTYPEILDLLIKNPETM